MASRRLTQRFVETVKPTDRDAFYWHTARIRQGARLGLKVTPTGKRTFVIQYRAIGGAADVARRLTLGATTLRDAETEARRLFRESQDPAGARREARMAERMADAIPLFLADLAGKKKPRTVYEWTRILGGSLDGRAHQGYVRDLYKLRVGDVSESTLATIQRRVWNGPSGKRPVMANRVIAVLSAFFSWCETQRLRPRGTNPARALSRYPERPMERFLTVEEAQRLSATLRLAETEGLMPASRLRRRSSDSSTRKHRPTSADRPRIADPIAVAALRFLVFSGYREQEALSLRWDSIDFDRGIVTLADTKSAKSARPLNGEMIAILKSQPRVSEYVFPGAIPGSPRREIKRLWYAVREAAQLDGVRLHDLRHTVASFAASGGASLLLIGAILGHKSTQSTRRYSHLFEAAQREAADRMAGDLRAAMDGRTTVVTPLRGRR